VVVTRVRLEARSLSQWRFAATLDAGLPMELLDTRHVRDAFKAMAGSVGGVNVPLAYFRP
jgi:hypothetical protein